MYKLESEILEQRAGLLPEPRVLGKAFRACQPWRQHWRCPVVGLSAHPPRASPMEWDFGGLGGRCEGGLGPDGGALGLVLSCVKGPGTQGHRAWAEHAVGAPHTPVNVTTGY